MCGVIRTSVMKIRWQAIKQIQLAQKKIQGGTLVITAKRKVLFFNLIIIIKIIIKN